LPDGLLETNVLAVDLDPQANLTAAFLDEDRLEDLWSIDSPHDKTIAGALNPLLRGVGDVTAEPFVEQVGDHLGLIVGDLELARSEDEFSIQWPQAGDGHERGFRVLSAFWRVVQNAAVA
jgi:cellulose biosynthesis protein BcsQ